MLNTKGIIGEKLKCLRNENKSKYEEIRAEYGSWLKDYEVAKILKVRRDNEICRQCKGLPCVKNNDLHTVATFKVDENTQSLVVSYATCKNWRNARRKNQFKNCKIPLRYIGKNFSDYEVTAGNKAAVAWARYAIKNPQEGLLFYGVPGCGKTMLVAILAQELVSKGKRLIFGDVPTILDELKNTFGGESQSTFEELMRELESTDVLILDDLGTENTTDWALERLYVIINNRYNAGKPIIVTSNYDAEGLIKRFKGGVVGKRIVSRLSEMCHTVEVGGGDRRLKGGG